MAERRSLLDDNVTPSHESLNVFDDEFEVEDFAIPADGFRPSDHDREGGARRSQEVRDQPVRSISAHYATSSISSMMPSAPIAPTRSSLRKSLAQQNPFESPEDDERTPSLSFEPDVVRRSVSSASSAQFAGTGTPRFGAGPSHPYNMYPQGTMARTASIATQSTIRAPTRQSISRNGPQHPYTLYPQGVDEDVDDEEPAVQNATSVGFPGLGQSYRRRVGPDGEEQDIVGTDGHAEQLPPYTRYPEDGPEKAPLLGVPAAPTALHSRAPVAGTDPTMDLMHNTLRPTRTEQAQSMTDQSNLQGRPASLSNIERMPSRAAEESLASNKSWSEKSWREKRKTTFCGCIPFWWILLAMGVIGFIIAVLGGVIGGFVEGAKKHGEHVFDKGSTSLYDASAIATPTAGAPPTGTFALALSTPQETQASCLTETGQQAAWSCDLAGDPAQAIRINIPPNNASQGGASIFYASTDDQICYGSQNSFMNTTFSPFITVQDNDAPSNGPAYYFQEFYDKVVVVPESAMSMPSGSKNKRQSFQLDQGWLQQKQVAKSGEQPWFCVWNNTFVEGFIYVEQPIVSTYSPTSSPASASAATSSPPPTLTITAPSEVITATVTMPSTTTVYTGMAGAYPSWFSYAQQHQAAASSAALAHSDDDDGDDDDGYGGHNRKRQPQSGDLYKTLQMFPYVVKIEERRLPGNTVQPYCQQFQILDDGGYGAVPGANGAPIIIQLEESDPGYGAYQSAGVAGSSRKQLEGRGQVSGGCHCQWLSGQSTA